MEKQFINYSNIFLNHKMLEDTVCDAGIKEHCLLYIYSGQIEFEQDGHKVLLREGECAFIRRDNRIKMNKKSNKKTGVYQSILLRFSRQFLHDFYRKLEPSSIPTEIKRSKASIKKIPIRPDVVSLFESIKPFFESNVEPSEQWLNMKMIEGLYVILNSDKTLYASLFDFTEAWKIDLMGCMQETYMYDLRLEALARYTAR